MVEVLIGMATREAKYRIKQTAVVRAGYSTILPYTTITSVCMSIDSVVAESVISRASARKGKF